MKHLFLARHGDWENETGGLSELGCQQTELLGTAIRSVLGGDSAYVVSSAAPRAIQSARILAKNLALQRDIETSEYLVKLNGEIWQSCYTNSMAFIEQRRNIAKGLILVTHKPEIEALFCYFMEKEWGKKDGFLNEEIIYGEAVYFDLEKKVWQFLPKSV